MRKIGAEGMYDGTTATEGTAAVVVSCKSQRQKSSGPPPGGRYVVRKYEPRRNRQVRDEGYTGPRWGRSGTH